MYRFIIFFMGIVIALGIGGCGEGHDTADTSGTDTISVTTDKTESYTGQSGIITATVKNAGKEVGGREVTFGFVANMTGATLTSTKVNTNAAGEAKALYIAGTNAGSDIVRASISNGAMMDVNIVVKVGGYSITVTADPNPLAAGEMSTIAAIVKNAQGTILSGVKVNFTFLTNKSGATLSPLLDGLTDAAGQATAIYTAGGNDPNITVQDCVSATVDSYSGIKIINRTDGAAGMTVTVTADPNSLAAGEKSTIAAIVKNAKGTAVSGVNVNFSFLTNRSGATLSPLSGGLTDASGQATAVYTAGGNDSNITVQDIVSATAGSYSGVEIITRTDGAGMTVTVTADPNSLAAGEMSTIAAIVKNAKGTAVSGMNVRFSIPTNNSGASLRTLSGASLSPLDVLTDASGQATCIYTAGIDSLDKTVQDSVTATVGSNSGVEIITRTVTALTVSLSANPNGFAGSWDGYTVESILTATVTGGSGSSVSGIDVTFSIKSTTVAGEQLDPLTAVKTNAKGEAVVRYTRPVTEGPGAKILVVLKAELPNGAYSMITMEIDG